MSIASPYFFALYCSQATALVVSSGGVIVSGVNSAKKRFHSFPRYIIDVLSDKNEMSTNYHGCIGKLAGRAFIQIRFRSEMPGRMIKNNRICLKTEVISASSQAIVSYFRRLHITRGPTRDIVVL